MSAWLWLALAIVGELIGTVSLKASDGFSKLGPSSLVVLGYALAFYCMAQALKHLPLGVVYALWSAVGITVLAGIGWAFFGEKLPWQALLGIGLIVVGVVLVSFYGSAHG